MALVAMAIYDTPDNGRSEFTRRTLESMAETLDATRHRVFLIINASTPETEEAVIWYQGATQCEVLRMPENVGTARAINQAWKQRKPGEHCLKMDNDVVFHQDGWLDLMEQAIAADPKIGIIGLRRPDLRQSPNDPDPFYRCYPKELIRNEKYYPDGNRVLSSITIEQTADVMGTCVLHNAALLDKVGYLYQPGLYGYDDVLMCIRSIQAGFYNCFLSREHVQIDHIDPGDGGYQKWKHKQAAEDNPEYHRLKEAYRSGKADLYCPAEY